MKRLTKRYLVKEIADIPLSAPINYERYYINDNLRIQNKNGILEKEMLDNNIVVNKVAIDEKEFELLKAQASSIIIKNSYLYLPDNRISIKEYLGNYQGLLRAEVKFSSEHEMANYEKESWMGRDITNSPLAFDKDLIRITREAFLAELQK